MKILGMMVLKENNSYYIIKITFRNFVSIKFLMMTATTIRNKVHKYIDEADNSVLEVVYKLLEVYRQSNSSLLTEEQRKEVLKRSALYKEGKLRGYTLEEVRTRAKKKLKN